MEETKEIDDDAATRERPERPQNGDSGPHAASVLPLASAAPETSELAAATRDVQPVCDANNAAQSASNATLSSAALSRGTRPTNPFDPRVSFKNPFPKFEDSMADFQPDADNKENNEESANECNTGAFFQSRSTSTAAVNLDWSIDTIAELKPMAFSPLPEQKASFSGGGGENSLDDTPDATATSNPKFNQFFDDEAQYKVLQTPSPLIRQQEQEREREQQQSPFQYLQQNSQRRQHYNASPSTPGPPPRAPTPPSTVHHSSSRRAGIPSSLSTSSSSSSDLHRRCQNAIAFCEGRVHERQRKLSRLQLPQSESSSFSASPAPHHKKNKNKRFRGDACEFPWKTTPKQRTSELRGIHPRTPASAGTGTTGAGFRPSQSPFSVPLTPIVSASNQMLRTPERNPRATAQRKSMQNEPEFSFDGGSPISPIAPCPGRTGDCSGGSSSTLLDKTILKEEEGEEKKNEQHEEASLSPILRRAPAKDAPSFRSLSFSVSDEEHDKENRRRQQPSARTKTCSSVPVPGSASSSSSDSPPFTLSSSWGKAAEDSFSLRTLARLQNSAGGSSSNSNSLSSISFISSSSLSSPPANPDPGPHSNSSSSSEPRSRSQTAAPAARNVNKLASPSIAQRQESFMAAIEAEARASKPQTHSSSAARSTSSSTTSSLRSSSACSNTVSIAELFQEARAMGISEPRAQWEYVQLLKKQRGVSGSL